MWKVSSKVQHADHSINLTHYTLSFIFYKSFWDVVPLLLQASTELRVLPSSLSGFMTSAMPSLVSLQWSGLSDQWTLLPTESCLQCQNWSPYKGRGAVSTPVCVKMAQPVLTMAFIQSAKTAAMCMACRDYAYHLPQSYMKGTVMSSVNTTTYILPGGWLV